MKLSEQWEAINRFRRSIPVDLDSLASAIGLRVKYAYLTDEISGMLERNETDAFVVTINSSHVPTRQRFTLAHEIGHYILHRSLVGDGLDDNMAYRSTDIGKYHNTSIGPREETEANRFAAELLMPMSLVNREWQSGDYTLKQMATRYGVSEAAMKIRLGV